MNNIKSEEAVKQTMDRIIKNVAIPMLIDDITLKICISTGYTIYPKDGITFDELYKIADKKCIKIRRRIGWFTKAKG